MSRAARHALVDHDDPALPVAAQCRLLRVARSSLYYQPVPASADELAVMRRIDELHLEYPFYGSRRLRGLIIDRPNQVWCADITYIPMAKGFVYLVAVMDWFSRRVLAWRLSITLETDFCVAALRDALERHGRPDIFNTDQGVQFTSAAFLEALSSQGVRISMDGKGRFLDNIFIERLWRSLKYEEVYIKAYGSVTEARRGIGGWLGFYNEKRPHQALGYRTPRVVHEGAACEYVDNACALPTYSQAHHQEEEVIMF